MRKVAIILAISLGLAVFAAPLESFAVSEENKETAILYLGQPIFGGDDFLKQITGCENISVEMIDPAERMIYFSIPSEEYTKKELARIGSTTKIEFGKTRDSQEFKISEQSDGPIILGKLRYLLFEHYFFRISFDDFMISNETLVYQFPSVIYDITLGELTAYRKNMNTFNGRTRIADATKKKVFVNHGAWVGKKEHSLTRLMNRITKNCKNSLEKAQALISFVNKEVQNNLSEANASFETMKNPNEVLMARSGDCSGKTTLLASLFEQMGAEYRLVYLFNGTRSGHIALALMCDQNFPSGKSYKFRWEGSYYLLVEATTRNFKIGDPPLQSVSGMKYIQKPGEDTFVFPSGEKLGYIM